MTASQFIAALQAGTNAFASAAAGSPQVPGSGPAQVSSASNPMPAPVTANQAAAASKAAAAAPTQPSATVKTDLISKILGWLIPSGWTPAKL